MDRTSNETDQRQAWVTSVAWRRTVKECVYVRWGTRRKRSHILDNLTARRYPKQTHRILYGYMQSLDSVTQDRRSQPYLNFSHLDYKHDGPTAEPPAQP